MALATVALVFVAATFVTLRWGDRTLYPAPAGAPTIRVFIVSHGYHAGIVLPRAALAEVASRRGYAALVAIASVTVPMAARALFLPGNRSVLHVVGLSYPPRAAFPAADIIALELSPEGFDRVLARIDATFAPAAGVPAADAGPGLYGPSRFYRARGTFNILHVCNHWLAELLDAAGVPTAPVLATLPAGLFLDLEWRAGLRPLARE